MSTNASHDTSQSDAVSTPASFFDVRVKQFSRDRVYAITHTFAVAPDDLRTDGDILLYYGTNLDRALLEECGFVSRDRIWECWPNEYLGAADAS